MASEFITLTDSASGASARIAPALGFNCFEFRAMAGSRPIDVLWREGGFESGGKSASGSGIPLLFPFPGRIAGTTLTWNDQQYQLEPGDGQGNAIHGFVHERPWRVLQSAATTAIGQFQASVDAPELLNCWPADFRITATYEISSNHLRSTYLMENPSDKPLPCGFGLHPYFRLPLGGPSAASCRVKLPVSTTWELVDMNPTGRQEPLTNADQFQHGQEFATLSLDNVFGGLLFDERHRSQAVIEDPQSGNRVTISFDRVFRECVVYTPGHRNAICIEPLTCVPDAIRLSHAGIDAGLRILSPGESFSAHIDLSLDERDT